MQLLICHHFMSSILVIFVLLRPLGRGSLGRVTSRCASAPEVVPALWCRLWR